MHDRVAATVDILTVPQVLRSGSSGSGEHGRQSGGYSNSTGFGERIGALENAQPMRTSFRFLDDLGIEDEALTCEGADDFVVFGTVEAENAVNCTKGAPEAGTAAVYDNCVYWCDATDVRTAARRESLLAVLDRVQRFFAGILSVEPLAEGVNVVDQLCGASDGAAVRHAGRHHFESH